MEKKSVEKARKKLEHIFICKNCGGIVLYNNGQNTDDLKCGFCKEPSGWKDSFSPLSAFELIRTSEDLFEQAKNVIKKIWNFSICY